MSSTKLTILVLFWLVLLTTISIIKLVHATSSDNDALSLKSTEIQLRCRNKVDWPNVTVGHLELLRNPKKYTQKLQCFTKCLYEITGYIDPRSRRFSIDRLRREEEHNMSANSWKKLVQCLDRMPAIRSCGDIRFVTQCF